jgi:hypothetical protein
MIKEQRTPKIPSFSLNPEGNSPLSIRSLQIIAAQKTRSTILDIRGHPRSVCFIFFGEDVRPV